MKDQSTQQNLNKSFDLCCEKLDFTKEMILDDNILSVRFKEDENKEGVNETMENLENCYNNIKDMFELEERMFAERSYNYMLTNQKYININMRAVLCDWLTEVSCQFGFKRNTLHNSICLLDRFLNVKNDLVTDKLQLVGITMLAISAKLEVSFVILSCL